MQGQLIQYTREGDPNSEENYYPYTLFETVFENETPEARNLKTYLEEKVLGSSDTGGSLGANAKTISGGALGEKSISDSGGAVGENATTLSKSTKIGIKVEGYPLAENAKLEEKTTVEKMTPINISILRDKNEIPSEAKNINITQAYVKNQHGSPKDYFNVKLDGDNSDPNKIAAIIYPREKLNLGAGDYWSDDTTENGRYNIPIYVDIIYQIETKDEGGSGFSGGFNSQASSGGAIGESSNTISGCAAGENAESTWGGAVGQNSKTAAGGAIGLRAWSQAGGAVGVDSRTQWGGAIGFMSESNWGFAGGQASSTNNGGAIGSRASSEHGGAVGSGAKSNNGFAGGLNANASGTNAIALGVKANASGNNSVQIGEGDNSTENSLKFKDHQISNGSAATSSGSDMAEYFEWKDGNINSEDRRGYFVTLDNEKIKFATSKDDYILGVISSEGIASFIGNTSAENWKNKYLKDIYGDYILDDNGNKKINPEYDKEQQYTQRASRKEWAVVCLIGQIVINDDGTCVPGGYCKVNDNGEGTVANIEDNIKYKVLERLDNNHVRILFR